MKLSSILPNLIKFVRDGLEGFFLLIKDNTKRLYIFTVLMVFYLSFGVWGAVSTIEKIPPQFDDLYLQVIMGYMLSCGGFGLIMSIGIINVMFAHRLEQIHEDIVAEKLRSRK